MAEPTDPGRVSPAIDAEREALLKTLVDHGVQFVVIGGAGIRSHGRRYDTVDIDLTRDRNEASLRRLADAPNELDCRLVTDPANPATWVPLPPDYSTPGSLLAATVWNLATRHGRLDLTFAPSGFPGDFGELAHRAEHITVAGTRIAVLPAALDDIHKSDGARIAACRRFGSSRSSAGHRRQLRRTRNTGRINPLATSSMLSSTSPTTTNACV